MSILKQRFSIQSQITETEVYECAHKMKRNSTSKCRIPVQMLLFIISSIVGILSTALNDLFIGVKDCYPPVWSYDEMFTKKRKVKCTQF